jgi:tetratricopeptide (TPR) repeat protein
MIEKAYNIKKDFYGEYLFAEVAHDFTPAISWPSIAEINRDQAIEYFKKALVLATNMFGDNSHMIARGHYMLGQAYSVNQQEPEAIDQYSKAAKKLEELLENARYPKIFKKLILRHLKSIREQKLSVSDHV